MRFLSLPCRKAREKEADSRFSFFSGYLIFLSGSERKKNSIHANKSSGASAKKKSGPKQIWPYLSSTTTTPRSLLTYLFFLPLVRAMSNHDVTMLHALKDNEQEGMRARTNEAKVSIRSMSIGFSSAWPSLRHMHLARRLRAKGTCLIFPPSSDMHPLFGRLNQAKNSKQ